MEASADYDGGFIRESEAIELVKGGSTWARVRIGSRALHRLIKNPDDTAQALLAGIALNAGMFPHLIARMVADDAGFALCQEQPLIDTKHVDFARLRALPGSTLGGAYVRYLDRNHLDPDLFHPPPGIPKVPQWIATRIRQTHDVWHALTAYGPDRRGELALQAFTYAQLGSPSSLVIASLGTAFREPRAAAMVLEGYRRGKAAVFLPVVRFEDHWERPIEDVRRDLHIPARDVDRPN